VDTYSQLSKGIWVQSLAGGSCSREVFTIDLYGILNEVSHNITTSYRHKRQINSTSSMRMDEDLQEEEGTQASKCVGCNCCYGIVIQNPEDRITFQNLQKCS